MNYDQMHYDYFRIAVLALFFGIFIFIDSIIGVAIPQWKAFFEPTTGIPVSLFLVTLGVVGIRRELWVRELERKAREK